MTKPTFVRFLPEGGQPYSINVNRIICFAEPIFTDLSNGFTRCKVDLGID